MRFSYSFWCRASLVLAAVVVSMSPEEAWGQFGEPEPSPLASSTFMFEGGTVKEYIPSSCRKRAAEERLVPCFPVLGPLEAVSARLHST